MSNYRRTDIDLSTRIALAIQLLCPIGIRPWGFVVQVAKELGVCRAWLYQLKQRAASALTEEFNCHQPGPKPFESTLCVDRDFLEYATVVLALASGSIRGIGQTLDLLFSVERSVGWICQTLQAACEKAEQFNSSIEIEKAVFGEADEIFQGKRPCLTVIDGRSFLVLSLKAEESRDATTWGCTFLDLDQRGIAFDNLVSDGAKGIRAGVNESQLAIPLRLDHFHLLREAQQVASRLERRAMGAIEIADRAQRADEQAKCPIRRRGRPLKVDVSLSDAQAQEQEAIDTYDLFVWLMTEIQSALSPVAPNGELADFSTNRETVIAAAELISEFSDHKAKALSRQILTNICGLMAPIEAFSAQLLPIREQLDERELTFIGWLWRHRGELGVDSDDGLTEELRPIVEVIFRWLGLFHRTSSLAESLHSFLRPYLVVHRGMPQWLLSLVQLYWNHHVFARGKRSGACPLQLAGAEVSQTLKEVLQAVCSSQTIEQTA